MNRLICTMAMLGTLLIIVATPQCSAEEVPCTGPDKEEKPFSWLVYNGSARSHKIVIEINGKPFTTLESGSSTAASKPLPFKDGPNTVRITFTSEGAGVRIRESSLKLSLSPTMLPGKEAALLEDDGTENKIAEIILKMEFANGRPHRLITTKSEWFDLGRKRQAYQYAAQAEKVGGEPDKTIAKQWYENGNLRSEVHEENGKVMTARDYNPDGLPNAEVKDGAGFRRTCFEDGSLYEEKPYKDGLVEGQWKHFHDSGALESFMTFVAGKAQGEYQQCGNDGKLQIKGAFQADLKEGVWTRYDAKGQEVSHSTFKHGKLTEGTDHFELE